MVCSAKLVDKQLQCFLGWWEGMVSKFLLGSSSRRTAFLDQTSMSCNPESCFQPSAVSKKVSKIRQFAEVESYRILVFHTISKQQ